MRVPVDKARGENRRVEKVRNRLLGALALCGAVLILALLGVQIVFSFPEGFYHFDGASDVILWTLSGLVAALLAGLGVRLWRGRYDKPWQGVPLRMAFGVMALVIVVEGLFLNAYLNPNIRECGRWLTCPPSPVSLQEAHEQWLRDSVCEAELPELLGDYVYDGLRWDEWILLTTGGTTSTRVKVVGLSEIAAVSTSSIEPAWVVVAKVHLYPDGWDTVCLRFSGSLVQPDSVDGIGWDAMDLTTFPPLSESAPFPAELMNLGNLAEDCRQLGLGDAYAKGLPNTG